MSCEDCRKAQETDDVIYYRFDNANIAIQCCAKHFKMLKTALRGEMEKAAKTSEKPLLKTIEFRIGLVIGIVVSLAALVVATVLVNL